MKNVEQPVEPTIQDAINLRKKLDLERALDIHRQLLQKAKYKKDPLLLAEHGAVLYQYRSLDDAEKYLKRSLKYGEVSIAYQYLALLENERGNLEKAESHIKRLFELAEDWDWERLFIQGMIQLRLGKRDEAWFSLRDTLDETEGKYLTSQMRGARLKLGKLLKKESIDWIKLGTIYEDLRREEEALHCYRTATKESPDNPDAWCILAESVKTNDEFEEVVSEGRLLHPQNTYLRCYEAELFYDIGMEYEALLSFQEIPGQLAKEWVERITREFDEIMEDSDCNPYLGDYGAVVDDYDDYYEGDSY
jgi:tetratricopeptide (TPR) repeat protein